MIKFDQVSKRYPGSEQILRNVSFSIDPGELVFVAGASGAGKSTLLKLIAATERPTSGTVLVGNQNVSKLRAAALPFLRRKFGLVFQDHKLLYDRNCFENVALPLRVRGKEEAGYRSDVIELPRWIKSACWARKKPCRLPYLAASSNAWR